MILFTQCKSKQSEVVVQTDTPATTYIGEWSYSFPFYSSELIIEANGAFKFHEQGCMGHGYSEGKWTQHGANIMLTSLEHYANNEVPKIIEVKGSTEATKPRENRKNKKGKIEYSFDSSFINTTVTYKFGPNDTTNVYFDKLQLRINGDTLYRLDSYGYRTDTKYIMVKNNR